MVMAKKYFRNSQAKFNYMHSLRAGFRRLFREAREKGYSHAYMMERRTKMLDGDRINTSEGSWQKLTSSEQAEILGYWSALADSLIDSLQFKYLIRGEWYTPKELIDRKDGVCPSADVPSPCTNGHYVHVIDTLHMIYY